MSLVTTILNYKRLSKSITYAVISIVIILCGVQKSTAQVSVEENYTTVNSIKDALTDTSAIASSMVKAKKLYKTNPDAAVDLYKNIIRASLRLHYERGLWSLSYISQHYINKSEYRASYRFLQYMLASVHKLGFKRIQISIFTSMALLYERWGNTDSAAHYYNQAISLMQTSFPDFSYKAALYNNYGSLLNSIGQNERAIYYLDKGEKAAIEENDSLYLTQSLLNKGDAWANLEDYKKSNNYLIQALSIAEKNGYANWQLLSMSNLSENYLYQKKYNEAIAVLEKAARIDKVTDPYYKNFIIIGLGEVYLEKRNFPKALYYLNIALRNAQALGFYKNIMYCHGMLYSLYKARGQYKQALESYEAYAHLKDSLDNAQVKQNINQLEVKFRTAQKDKDIVANQLKLKQQEAQIRQKNSWLIGISAAIVLLVAVGLLLYRNNWHKQRFQREKLRSLEQEQEINQLKAIMKGEEKERGRIAQELHDGIGGMLASLKMSVDIFQEEHPDLRAEPDLDRIATLLSGTATEVRRTAHNLMPNILVKQSLKEALLLYCENHSNKHLLINLYYHVDRPLVKIAEVFIYRMVQELVQNIVKHAQAKYAAIQVMLHDNEVNITIEDDGIGFDITKRKRGSGLDNIQSRVEALQGYFSLNSSIKEGTTVHIKMNYNNLNRF